MTHRLLGRTATILVLALAATSCGPNEFVATADNFRGFRTWTRVGEVLSGPGPMAAALGGAHGAGDATMRRSVFVNRAAITRTNGTFAVGTVFVKLVENADGTVSSVLGMAKRGNSFNAANNDWEWFVLDGEGAIAQRGADLFGGLCNNCHRGGARERDFVFSVP
ncbi:MAG: cytochrome P460 family protein [Deltaproteobacteria bacterium]|nr:cytochrome P460 family protein [Deltaproteobacteria bacterium]